MVLLLIRTKGGKLCNISMVDLEAHDTVFCFFSVVTFQSLTIVYVNVYDFSAPILNAEEM